MASGDLEAVLKSEARKINNPDASLSWIDRATEYLSYLANLTKRELRARRLAREISSLEIASKSLQTDQEEYKGSGVLSWINKKLGSPSIPARLAYTTPIAIAAVSPFVQGCATQELPRGSLGGLASPAAMMPEAQAKIDTELLNLLSQYLDAARDKDRAKHAYTSQQLAKRYGIHTSRIEGIERSFQVQPAMLNSYLINKNTGLIAVRIFPAYSLHPVLKRDVFDGIIVNGEKKKSILGLPIKDTECFYIGKSLYSTHKEFSGDVAQAYSIIGDGVNKSRNIIITTPQILRFFGASNTSFKDSSERDTVLRELDESVKVHEYTHWSHKIFLIQEPDDVAVHEKLAYLMQFSYKISKDIESVEDIVRYLQPPQNLSRSKTNEILMRGLYTGKLGKFTDQTKRAKDYISAGLPELAEQVHAKAKELNARYIPDKHLFVINRWGKIEVTAPDQQIWAMARYLYNQVLEQNPKFRPTMELKAGN